MAATAVRAAPPAGGAREAPATGPLAAPGIARLVGFVPLALFGGLHWGALLTPKADGTLILAVILAAAAGALLLVTGPDPRHWVRASGAVAATFGLAFIGLLLAGVPLRLLVPDAWGELAAGVAQGMESLPAITVPYRGADEWVRSALVLSGAGITGLGALLAFWPRRTARTPGFPLAAAVALGALYTIPIVERGPQSPYLGGALFCLLLATFLWLERLRADQVGVAAACVVAVTVAGAIVAPRLDADSPWLDYEQIAESLQPEKAATFRWDHSYGPMTWPRDGREVLRIRAPEQSYWKTVNLDQFDGLRWVDSGGIRRVVDTEMLRTRRDWFQTIRVVDRGVRSRQFVTAGHAIAILRGGPGAVSLAPGTFETAGRPLAPGSSYRAQVYVPRPSERQLRRAATDYPEFAADYLDIRLPQRRSRTSAAAVRFHTFGQGGEPDVLFGNGFQPGNGQQAMDASPYARAFGLAKTLRARAATPYQYMQAVLDRVRDGATYSESPPPSAVPLVDFLFGSRLGYCQQFSGAMALLLRMGGVPARVATGFSPGRFDRKRGEYIVRDDDAHSWVEVYFPHLGWVTMDPTPAASPARSQITDQAGPAAPGQRPDFGLGQAGDRPTAPGDFGTARAERDGTNWLPPALLGGLLAVGLLAALVVVVRRGRLPGAPLAPELAELQRALHRTGRTPPAATTLSALERSLGGSDAALGYLRALRAQRYGGATQEPTPQERRALRRELGAGLGLGGRLRAWWALPPARGGRRAPYTA
jgi:transglutaminase-like putative cysteine protease